MKNATLRAAVIGLLSIIAVAAHAADYPAPQSGDWIAHDFRFHTGQVLPELHLH
jgi:homoserine O-acetyltransferase